ADLQDDETRASRRGTGPHTLARSVEGCRFALAPVVRAIAWKRAHADVPRHRYACSAVRIHAALQCASPTRTAVHFVPVPPLTAPSMRSPFTVPVNSRGALPPSTSNTHLH